MNWRNLDAFALTGGLISTLTGSHASDKIGNNVTLLTGNNNFVTYNTAWNSNTGAVTWGSGTAGVSGVVSSSNSLVGSNTNDEVGINGITALSNGNYVVDSYQWDGYTGAVTWGSGTTGISGVVSSSNSLVGSTSGTSSTGDRVGIFITLLTNSNYVVSSSQWDGYTGAVTWGSGTTGISGVVSSSNSLVGSTSGTSSTGDQVGIAGVTALTNGNYVVRNYAWNGGTTNGYGAVTWGSGMVGVSGVVSSSNSLVGSNTGDRVGNYSVKLLANGNYVVDSYYWNSNIGAVTWGNGTTGITGIVSSANSLVGSTSGTSSTGDQVGLGGVTVLTNGNYVVDSYDWSGYTGAVTWGSGTAGVSGVVSSSNSLIGSTSGTSSTGDQVGLSSITALSNGNYVVDSPYWNGGGYSSGYGAVTWGSGTTGISGVVSSSNSLVGSHSGDDVGTIKLLTNGNYVVSSSNWNGDTGEVTWGSGTTGISGVVSSSNSLVGSTGGDNVGIGNVTALTNGNYVVVSWSWSGGTTNGLGAVTWGNGTAGVTGVVSSSNSLVGSNTGDRVGYNASITALTNGNYVVGSPTWNSYRGAATWGNGTTGISGVVSSANSLVGSTGGTNITGDQVGSGSTALSSGNYVVDSSAWDGGIINGYGAVTWGSGTSGVSGAVSSTNSLVGSHSGDLVGYSIITALSNGNYVVKSANWNSSTGAFTLGSGTSGVTGVVSSANSILGPSTSAGLGSAVEDATDGTFVVSFKTAGTVYVAPSSDNLNTLNFSFLPGANFTVDNAYLASVLGSGTNVTLQANNDITVASPLSVSGTGGSLQLDAGRSILVDANITTANGNLTLYANEPTSAGTGDADRDSGTAVITMAGGTTINAGTGAVDIELMNGAGLTNNTAGNLTLNNVSGGSIFARNYNSSGNVVLNGALSASGSGNALTLVSAGNFINNDGAGALSASGGQWLVYSTNPADDTIGGLSNGFHRYSCTYGGSCPSFPASGNGLLYSYTPVLNVTANDATRLYGTPNPTFTYTLSGFVDGDTSSSFTGTPSLSAPGPGSALGPHDITASAGSLQSLGYQLNFVPGTLTVNANPILSSVLSALNIPVVNTSSSNASSGGVIEANESDASDSSPQDNGKPNFEQANGDLHTTDKLTKWHDDLLTIDPALVKLLNL